MEGKSYTEQLIDRFKMEEELALMAAPAKINKDIELFTGMYHRAIKAKNNDLADCVNNIIEDLRKELEDVRRSISHNTRQVSTSQPSGNKKVFILQR
jgi:hypothetical protein